MKSSIENTDVLPQSVGDECGITSHEKSGMYIEQITNECISKIETGGK